eukprot:4352592-Karenia_brevis.AAC.1
MDAQHKFTLRGAANEAKIKTLTMRSMMMMVALINIMVIKLGMMMLITVILQTLMMIRHALRAHTASRKPRYVGDRSARET